LPSRTDGTVFERRINVARLFHGGNDRLQSFPTSHANFDMVSHNPLTFYGLVKGILNTLGDTVFAFSQNISMCLGIRPEAHVANADIEGEKIAALKNIVPVGDPPSGIRCSCRWRML